MVQATRGVQQVDLLRQQARHVLFVEGAKANVGFDVAVLGELLGDVIDVKPLGASYSVSSVAEALHPYHADYYFLVDRDHQDDTMVNKSWDEFPNPNTNNLLVWRRREIESYFVISSFLEHIEMTGANPTRIRTTAQIDEIVLKAFRKRLYFDAANQVIVKIREDNKANWITLFEKQSELPDAETARRRLVEHPAFTRKSTAFKKQIGRRAIKARFNEVLLGLTGGKDSLEFGYGTWLERLRAKPVWKAVANQCFKVVDRDGREIRGAEKAKHVALALVRRPLADQPDDFQTLHRMISRRVGRPAPR